MHYFIRSSRYSSDIGKMIECPVFHVNGDYPEVRRPRWVTPGRGAREEEFMYKYVITLHFFYFVIDTFNVSGSGTSMSSSDTISNEV